MGIKLPPLDIAKYYSVLVIILLENKQIMNQIMTEKQISDILKM